MWLRHLSIPTIWKVRDQQEVSHRLQNTKVPGRPVDSYRRIVIILFVFSNKQTIINSRVSIWILIYALICLLCYRKPLIWARTRAERSPVQSGHSFWALTLTYLESSIVQSGQQFWALTWAERSLAQSGHSFWALTCAERSLVQSAHLCRALTCAERSLVQSAQKRRALKSKRRVLTCAYPVVWSAHFLSMHHGTTH